MVVQGLRAYRSPPYPDMPAILDDPYILKTLPERWKRNAAVCAALAATSAMLLTACGSQAEPAAASTGPRQTSSPLASLQPTPSLTLPPTPSPSPSLTPLPTPSPQVQKGIPVPLFEHGVGRGGFGCVSVAPPAFLSEDEAFEVIKEEAAGAGLLVEQRGVQLENIDLPITSMYTDKTKHHGYLKGTLVLDGINEEKKIAYEYVSTEDIELWRGKSDMASSVSDYDFLNTAKDLSVSINQYDSGMAVAVFYDPGYKYDDSIRQIVTESGTEDAAIQQIKELVQVDLRAQVRDFIAWLKAQGII
jgi:hypothetical protein